jgi:hypothetical protein
MKTESESESASVFLASGSGKKIVTFGFGPKAKAKPKLGPGLAFGLAIPQAETRNCLQCAGRSHGLASGQSFGFWPGLIFCEAKAR